MKNSFPNPKNVVFAPMKAQKLAALYKKIYWIEK